MKKLIAVFGPDSVPNDSMLYHEAQALGRLLAQNNFVALSGGYAGIMEAVSRGARHEGGSVIGVTAEVYHARGREPNEYISREVRVKSANDRLMELIDLADAYVAIGNSTGTLNEIVTAWDYMIKQFIPQKPMILVGETWRYFLDYVHRDAGFKEVDLLYHVDNADAALHKLIDVFGIQHNLPDLNVVKQ